jgi:hypothetical protein
LIFRGKLERLRAAKQHQIDLDFHEENLSGIRLRQKKIKERKIDRPYSPTTPRMCRTR